MELPEKRPFENVLVAIDGSEVSMRAAEHAARIAKHDGAELSALLVILAPAYKVPGEIADYYSQAREEAKGWIREVEIIAERHDLSLRSEILVGAMTAIDGILGYAEKISADLIVTGRRGKASSTRRLIGSVSSGLVEFADCSVLVVK
jgi:nucleotide-binding universal stress UspA family protein